MEESGLFLRSNIEFHFSRNCFLTPSSDYEFTKSLNSVVYCFFSLVIVSSIN
nr:MAG TPA: hypothetical protein [Caudoviricetes sp.]